MITEFKIYETTMLGNKEKSYQELGIIPEAGDYLTVTFHLANGTPKVGIMYIQKVYRKSFDFNWFGQMGEVWTAPHTMRCRVDQSVPFDKVIYHGKDL